MKHPAAIFSREETSPDGSLHIFYNYSEGEKSPTIIEPGVTVIATGEVLFDFWGSRLNGHLDDFNATGFRLTVSDNYNVTTILVHVDVRAKTFTLANDPAAPRPLSTLCDTLFWIVDRVRTEREKASSPRPKSHPSFISRLRGWFR
jgi:hypothetical protein